MQSTARAKDFRADLAGRRTLRPVSPAGQYRPPALSVADSEAEISSAARAIFDQSFAQLRANRWNDGMQRLFVDLTALRRRSDEEKWANFCESAFYLHPIFPIVQQDPITRHSYSRPRGYAGDAGLLDLIYEAGRPPAGCTAVGARVWSYTVKAPEAVAVRERRDLLAKEIDHIAMNRRNPRILSLACGYLREAMLSEAVAQGIFLAEGTFRAIDQDQVSIREVEDRLASRGITALLGSVRGILQGKFDDGGYDFIYAAGLYDYLKKPVATKLTSKLFSMLLPGGRLLLTNFTPNGFGTGYIETFMRWQLIYRDERGLEDLAEEIPEGQIASRRLFRSSNGLIVYVELVRV